MRLAVALRFVAIVGVWCLLAGPSRANTVQTFGSGSAVGTADRVANFDPLSANGTPISDYVEDGLFIGVDGDSWVGTGSPVFDPFHGANGTDHAFECPYGGSLGWVTIYTTDNRKIFGFEFLYGNGWTTGDIYGPYPWGNNLAIVEWQTWNGNTMVSSGTIGGAPLLEMGTVVGFRDAAGFDRLLMKCTIASSYDPNLQVLALDNVRVALTYNVTAVAPPRAEPSLAIRSIVPNPARDGVLIAFDLPRSGPVRVVVHDVTGRLVRELIDGAGQAGPGAVRWDGLDRQGQRVPSGLYAVRLTSNGRTTRRSITVVR